MERDDLSADQAILDAAFASLPLAPLPVGFAVTVMRQVTERPRFQIQFLDVAIPFSLAVLVFSLVSAALWLAGWLTFGWLPAPPATLSLPELWPAMSSAPWLGVALILLAIEAGLAAVAGACVMLWIDLPTWRVS